MIDEVSKSIETDFKKYTDTEQGKSFNKHTEKSLKLEPGEKMNESKDLSKTLQDNESLEIDKEFQQKELGVTETRSSSDEDASISKAKDGRIKDLDDVDTRQDNVKESLQKWSALVEQHHKNMDKLKESQDRFVVWLRVHRFVVWLRVHRFLVWLQFH